MIIHKIGMAGTLESSDVSVVIEPNNIGKGIEIYLKSAVEKQFGNQIRQVILDTLSELQVTDAVVRVHDKGALDCVIKARVQTAVFRASDEAKIDWREGIR